MQIGGLKEKKYAKKDAQLEKKTAISIEWSYLLMQMSLFSHENYLLFLIQNKTSATFNYNGSIETLLPIKMLLLMSWFLLGVK